MKQRLGFVSNSSSSSFIIRKAVLSDEQLNELRLFFDKHKNWYETEMHEDSSEMWGEVEAHNGVEGNEPASILLEDIIDSFQIPIPLREYFDCKYDVSVELKELSEKSKKYIATLNENKV